MLLSYGGDGGRFHYASLSVAPCSDFPLGTDPLGRDLLYAICRGALPSFAVGLMATCMPLLTCVLAGSVLACLPPALRSAGLRLIEVLSGLPRVLVLLFLSVFLRAGLGAHARRAHGAYGLVRDSEAVLS